MHVCTTCESVFEKPEAVTPGSGWIEIVLWCCLAVPGLIYSIWRLASRKKECPACGASSVLPGNTPAALRIIEKHPQATLLNGGGRGRRSWLVIVAWCVAALIALTMVATATHDYGNYKAKADAAARMRR